MTAWLVRDGVQLPCWGLTRLQAPLQRLGNESGVDGTCGIDADGHYLLGRSSAGGGCWEW